MTDKKPHLLCKELLEMWEPVVDRARLDDFSSFTSTLSGSLRTLIAFTKARGIISTRTKNDGWTYQPNGLQACADRYSAYLQGGIKIHGTLYNFRVVPSSTEEGEKNAEVHGMVGLLVRCNDEYRSALNGSLTLIRSGLGSLPDSSSIEDPSTKDLDATLEEAGKECDDGGMTVKREGEWGTGT